jgi:hypothetical protein
MAREPADCLSFHLFQDDQSGSTARFRRNRLAPGSDTSRHSCADNSISRGFSRRAPRAASQRRTEGVSRARPTSPATNPGKMSRKPPRPFNQASVAAGPSTWRLPPPRLSVSRIFRVTSLLTKTTPRTDFMTNRKNAIPPPVQLATRLNAKISAAIHAAKAIRPVRGDEKRKGSQSCERHWRMIGSGHTYAKARRLIQAAFDLRTRQKRQCRAVTISFSPWFSSGLRSS